MGNEQTNEDGRYLVPASLLISGVIIAGAILYQKETPAIDASSSTVGFPLAQASEITPNGGIVLPVVWGDLGARLVSAGAIDNEKFQALYASRGQFTPEYRELLLGVTKDNLKITPENAQYILNLFWALGLSSKNPILEDGEMSNPQYGGAGNFASTGGWTLAKGHAMDHYSRHKFFNLTEEQQALVEKVSQNIYRPCCDNSTHFPDCNHGMAMLGLLELMASQGAGEQDMYKAALAVNSYWFSGTYQTISSYKSAMGVEWKDVDPAEVLGVRYSSAQGFKRVSDELAKINAGRNTVPSGRNSSGGCSV